MVAVSLKKCRGGDEEWGVCGGVWEVVVGVVWVGVGVWGGACGAGRRRLAVQRPAWRREGGGGVV
eukprot:COSAG06_NODE_53463_length_300_cov_0.472637_1_plen_65_part_00